MHNNTSPFGWLSLSPTTSTFRARSCPPPSIASLSKHIIIRKKKATLPIPGVIEKQTHTYAAGKMNPIRCLWSHVCSCCTYLYSSLSHTIPHPMCSHDPLQKLLEVIESLRKYLSVCEATFPNNIVQRYSRPISFLKNQRQRSCRSISVATQSITFRKVLCLAFVSSTCTSSSSKRT